MACLIDKMEGRKRRTRIKRKIKVKGAAAAGPQESTVPRIVVEDYRAVSRGGGRK